MLRILTVLLAAAFAASPARAEVYKCLGAHGLVTYQDTPCGAGAVENVIEIVDDRSYNAPPSAEMKKAAEELRKKDRELVERLDKERAERQLREAERPQPYYGSGSRYQPPMVGLVGPYWGSIDAWRPGFSFIPHRISRRHAIVPGTALDPTLNCLACPLLPGQSLPQLRHVHAHSHFIDHPLRRTMVRGHGPRPGLGGSRSSRVGFAEK
ncbi:MAG: DUF4124 domain-containing protein [Chromatiales bacterium]